MEESVKNRIIVILVVLTAIFFMGTVGSCSNASRLKSSRDQEMAIRLDLEERMSNFTQEKQGYEEQIKGLTQGLEEEKVAHQATKKALLQEQLVNQSLKDELQKMIELKEALEEDLKEALVAVKAKNKQ